MKQTERQTVITGRFEDRDAELRSWISNVIVPAMVRDFIAEHGSAIGVAEPIAVVPQCEANVRPSAEGIH